MSDLTDQHRKEALYQTLDSTGWRQLLEHFVAEMRALSAALIENPELPDAQRRGNVYALNHLKEGISRAYTKAGREMPSWLKKEFYWYRDEEQE